MILQMLTTEIITGHARMPRRRRVRASYPAALVELALVLCGTLGTREAASVLGVGVSTVYRWVGLHRTAWMPRNFVHTAARPFDDVLTTLSTRCARAGFSVTSPSEDSVANSTNHSTDLSREFSTATKACGTTDIAKNSTSDLHIAEAVTRARREIEDHFATRWSCQTLAERVGLPRFQFIKKFAAAFGVPPYHYLLGVRVKRAWELLQCSDAPLPAVAAATGFGSAASMQRAFKRFAGASPSKVVNLVASVSNSVPANSYTAQKVRECVASIV